MSEDPSTVARRWSKQLPREFARRLAAALLTSPDAVRALKPEAVLPQSGAAVALAGTLAEQGHGPFLAGLLTARLDVDLERPRITSVWTGPESAHHQGRLTLAVLSDLIDEAKSELLLASYATYPSNEIRDALSAAALRNVDITLLLERTTDNPSFKGSSDPFPNLAARRLCWPAGARPSGASMHAKVLVVDRRIALVGSANLTGYGLERNLECGLLVRGGSLPGQLADHLQSAQGIAGIG